MSALVIDITGQRFGALTVVGRQPNARAHTGACWTVRCDCGREITVISVRLRRGQKKSCGCLSAVLVGRANTRHGGAAGNRSTPEYQAWCSMRKRCLNPRDFHWPHYGARGISICERWDLFENFLADMGPRPSGFSLDRIDNNGNYEPVNCRWATALVQSRNRRPSSLWKRRNAS